MVNQFPYRSATVPGKPGNWEMENHGYQNGHDGSKKFMKNINEYCA